MTNEQILKNREIAELERKLKILLVEHLTDEFIKNYSKSDLISLKFKHCENGFDEELKNLVAELCEYEANFSMESVFIIALDNALNVKIAEEAMSRGEFPLQETARTFKNL